MAIAVSGAEQARQTATASQVYMYDVLEQLAVVAGGASAEFSKTLAETLGEGAPGARTIVISTRSRATCELEQSPVFERDRRLAHALSRAAWIDVSGEELRAYFHWGLLP